MKCPKCNSSTYVKDGIVKGRQRFLCKECYFRYTVKQRSLFNKKRTSIKAEA